MNEELIEFIKESRKRGFSDIDIKKPLLFKGWFESEIDEALEKADNPEKERVCFYIDKKILALVEKRAKKNMLTLEKQIEDIVRRSCINSKNTKTIGSDTDDKLVAIFSRKKRKKKAK